MLIPKPTENHRWSALCLARIPGGTSSRSAYDSGWKLFAYRLEWAAGLYTPLVRQCLAVSALLIIGCQDQTSATPAPALSKASETKSVSAKPASETPEGAKPPPPADTQATPKPPARAAEVADKAQADVEAKPEVTESPVPGPGPRLTVRAARKGERFGQCDLVVEVAQLPAIDKAKTKVFVPVYSHAEHDTKLDVVTIAVDTGKASREPVFAITADSDTNGGCDKILRAAAAAAKAQTERIRASKPLPLEHLPLQVFEVDINNGSVLPTYKDQVPAARRPVQGWLRGDRVVVRRPGVKTFGTFPLTKTKLGGSLHTAFGHRGSGIVLVVAFSSSDSGSDDGHTDSGDYDAEGTYYEYGLALSQWPPEVFTAIDSFPCTKAKPRPLERWDWGGDMCDLRNHPRGPTAPWEHHELFF